MGFFDISSSNIMHGKYISLWWDGQQIAEVKSFKAQIEIDRVDIFMIGSNDVASKINCFKGTGTMKLRKIFTRGWIQLFYGYKLGMDPQSILYMKWDDPNAKNNGVEQLVLTGVQFNTFTLMDADIEKYGEIEYPFRFKITSSYFFSTINPFIGWEGIASGYSVDNTL